MKIKGMYLSRNVTWLLFVLVLGLISYFTLFRAVQVKPYRVTRGEVVVEALGTGSVESRRTISVGFEVTGRVVDISVDQGERVHKGQVLAELDSKTFKAEMALAEQEVSLAQTSLSRFKADVKRAQAVFQGAEDALNRIRPLVKSGASSEEELDVASERYQVALAELASAQAGELVGQENILTAQRRLDRAKEELNRTVVYSPFDGIVLRREREVGDVAVPGAAVLKLAATDTVWASVWVDEIYLDMLSSGLLAKIVLRSEPTQTISGSVSRIGREVDRETRELLVDVVFDKLPEKLAFGQRVDLWIEVAKKSDALRIPSATVVWMDGREGVLVAKGSRAKFLPLQFGLRGRELIEVNEGLSEGDIVLAPSLGQTKKLTDGQRISLLDLAAEEVRQ
jgi:HlyD family secretion protein